MILWAILRLLIFAEVYIIILKYLSKYSGRLKKCLNKKFSTVHNFH